MSAASDRAARIAAEAAAHAGPTPDWSPIAVAVPIGTAISVGQPASGPTQLIIGPPAGEMWKIHSLRSIFTCDATAGDRVLVAAFTSAALGDVWSMSAGIAAQAGQVIEASGGKGSPAGGYVRETANGGEGLTSITNITWPEVWIPADVTLRVWMFTGTGAADTFSSAQVLVEKRVV